MVDCCLLRYLTAFQNCFLFLGFRFLKEDDLAFQIIFTTLLHSLLNLEYCAGLADLSLAACSISILACRVMFFVSHGMFLLCFRDCCGMQVDMISMNLLCQLVAERSVSSSCLFHQSSDMLFCSQHPYTSKLFLVLHVLLYHSASSASI